MLQKLSLNVTPFLQDPSEHGWTPNDDSMRFLFGRHNPNEIVESLTDVCVLVSSHDERTTLLFESRGCTLSVGVDESYDLEARTKFTGSLMSTNMN